jgi:hypothetical protein
MPFMPAAMGAVLSVLLITAWLKYPQKHQVMTLTTGGLIGIFMLIRPEIGLILPFLGLAALMHLVHQPRVWFKGMILVAIGTVLVISPWIWRNFQLTGTLFIDQPNYRIDLFARRFREDPLGFDAKPPQSTQEETAVVETPKPTSSDPKKTKVPALESTERLAEDVIVFAQENPGTVLASIRNHFLNNIVQTVLYLPSSYRFTESAIHLIGHRSWELFWHECCSLDFYTFKLPFWRQWDGFFPNQSLIPILVSLFFIANGIVLAWRSGKFIGLLPIFAALGYYLVNAIALNSGGRYILPFDWVGILYYSIGLAGISTWGLSHFKKMPKTFVLRSVSSRKLVSVSTPLLTKQNMITALLFLMVGCTLPLVEKIIPSHFTNIEIENKISALLDSTDTNLPQKQVSILKNFTDNSGKAFLGQAFYPRFNKPQESGSVWDLYQPRSFGHVDFYLSAPSDTGVVLPMPSLSSDFRHASNVIVFGCRKGRNLDALAIVFYSDRGDFEQILFRNPIPDELSCPFSSLP